MNDKINDAIEIHDFTLKLVDELYKEGIINNKEIIPDEVTDLITEALTEESKENSNISQIKIMKE